MSTSVEIKKIPPGIYKRIIQYLFPHLRYFILAVIGFVLFAVSQPAFAVLMEAFVNALDGKIVNGLYLIPLGCAGIALFRGIGSYLGSYYMSKLNQVVVYDIRKDLLQNMLNLPTDFYDKNKSGRLISLFTYNTAVMTMTTAGAITTLIREGLTVIALFSYLIYQNYKLTLIFILLGPPLALLIRWIGKHIKNLGHSIQSAVGEFNHVTSEIFSSVRLIKSLAAEQQAMKKFLDISDDAIRLGLKMAKVGSIYTPLMQIMVISAMSILMYVVLLSRGTMDSAALIAYVTAAALLPKPIRSLSGVHPGLLQGAVAAQEVFRHIDLEKEINQGTINGDNHKIQGDIIFENVSFGYEDESNNVLIDISFHAEPGKTIALVGRSGAGKSTLISLIPRFYQVTSGRILIDGEPIVNYELNFLRKNIATVSQNVTLFNTTIAENISYSLSNVDRNKIINAAKDANAHEFIKELPEGYDTLIGENGVLLSGGQRQRVAIARAILRDAPILILDEATSALDNESEVKVQNALDRIMRNRTTIVIAHRLSTIEHADKILLFDQGKIIEEGSHQDLMSFGGQYAKMVRRDFNE